MELQEQRELEEHWRLLYVGLTRAIERLVEVGHVRTRPRAMVLTTGVAFGEGGPGPFCERQGFVHTGEMDEGERAMRRAP